MVELRGLAATEMDDDVIWSVTVDQLEYRARDGTDVGAGDASAWIGNDDYRLKLTAEVGRDSGCDMRSCANSRPISA